MIRLPKLRILTQEEDFQTYSNVYEQSSGLPIPESYLGNPNNKVFAIYWDSQMIGGFILGNGPVFRTIELFAQPQFQADVYAIIETPEQYTEICCFWIKRAFRVNTKINFFIWLTMIYALKRYGSKYALFGTCSCSLAKLYGQTSRTYLIHEDKVKGKSTFIFWGRRSVCMTGILGIMKYKLKRVLKLSQATSLSFIN